MIYFVSFLLGIAVLFLAYRVNTIARQIEEKSTALSQSFVSQSDVSADTNEIVAAIVAAITAYRSEDVTIPAQNVKAFRVVSFRKK